ncbi:TrmH family RNA methyltransferase [Myceligenerans pegani]|uniref:RNA methyltransferase n=1 Tax=Myceligenerans pegani TaxID=2776917 RepID=A0ABR9N078_9MICO|nr:RNA methyltransferase [Myceligenerans sp. TRM 65318]MBE1876488.1 RNA methyltransferase [Myceligenerans sp. TRM 65318]MBE3018759.1 RNA methyltransferase [Myceligenerans sp. TRM 65318]
MTENHPDARTAPSTFDVTLANPRADRVRQVRALSGRSARSRHGLFLVEGPQGVREAVRWAPDGTVRDVYLTAAAAERYPEIVDAAKDNAAGQAARTGSTAGTLRIHVATPEVLAAMSPDAQGVLAVLRSGHDEAGAALPAARLVAILSNVRDPGNAGTVIRAADAAGADAVILAGESVDVHNPKVVRATAGSLFHLPVVTGRSLADVVARLRATGCQVLAADGAGEHDLDELQDTAGQGRKPDLAGPTAWVFGNEAWGLPEADRALADAVVRVPIRGRAESLNLATAAAVCLYASSRAQR